MPDPALRTSVLERFLRYVQIDTQSSDSSTTYPSTPKQLVLLDLLVGELQAIEERVARSEKRYRHERGSDSVLRIAPIVDAAPGVRDILARRLRGDRDLAAFPDRLGHLVHQDVVAENEDAPARAGIEGREGERKPEGDHVGRGGGSVVDGAHDV